MDERSDGNFEILKMPHDILVLIISMLNARERVALGKTCKVFEDLVFNNKMLLRELDFSEEAFLTAPSHVEAYFKNENALEYLLKLNVSGMYCPKSAATLLRTIGKARNLIDVNITGFKFEMFKELVLFLEPLKQLKKLSCGWPTDPHNHEQHNKYLAGPFGKLTHLSLTVYDSTHMWTLVQTLDLCHRLEEFRVLLAYESFDPSSRPFYMPTMYPLDNIRLLTCYGEGAISFEKLVQNNLLLDCDRWARSDPIETRSAPNFYYEKDLEICNEFIEEVPVRRDLLRNQMGCWYLSQRRLFYAVVDLKIKIGGRNRCFFSNHTYPHPCLMKSEDAKLLLENPRHQLSYLALYHEIDSDCDVHLIATIFPKLTKLVLRKLKVKPDMMLEEFDFEIGKKRKRSDSEESDEPVDQNPAFKKLVENTPSLEDFTLYAEKIKRVKSILKAWLIFFISLNFISRYLLPSQMPHIRNQNWDLGALHFIGGWTALRTLWLANVPIKDGDFLIKIGEGCKNLKKIRLENLGSYKTCCYKEGLMKMLRNCVNLEDFSIRQNNVVKIYEIFEILADIPKLRRVRVEILGRKRKLPNLIPAIEKLIRSCNLIILVCEIKGFNQNIVDRLESTLEGLKKELKRYDFEFEVLWWKDNQKPTRNFDLEFAHRDLMLSHSVNDYIYRYNLC